MKIRLNRTILLNCTVDNIDTEDFFIQSVETEFQNTEEDIKIKLIELIENEVIIAFRELPKEIFFNVGDTLTLNWNLKIEDLRK